MPLESKFCEVLTATFELLIVLFRTTNPLEYSLQGTYTPANMAALSCTCRSFRSKSPRVLVSRLTAHWTQRLEYPTNRIEVLIDRHYITRVSVHYVRNLLFFKFLVTYFWNISVWNFICFSFKSSSLFLVVSFPILLFSYLFVLLFSFLLVLLVK